MRDMNIVKAGLAALLALAVAQTTVAAEELPLPSLSNSLLVSIEHNLHDGDAVALIKRSFPWGLYAWLSFSRTALFLSLDWTADPGQADAGISSFKSEVDALIRRAREEGVHVHIVMCSGLARG
ncbi:MAG: hypothetical protein FJY83_06590, partial [Candidatus Aminicenantes bacterium]|nr:hypothetical protein [Candidatus Aminicenantes bacterium]